MRTTWYHQLPASLYFVQLVVRCEPGICLQIGISSIRCISVSACQNRRRADGDQKGPSVVKEPVPRTFLRKQKKPLQIPKWFSYQALHPENASTEPLQTWSADQRTWLATCLNTVFDNCLVLHSSQTHSL